MDVLAYSAFNQKIALNQEIVEKNSCLDTKCSETASVLAVAAGLSDNAVCWVKCVEPCLLREPYRTSYWSCIPTLAEPTGGFKVCDSTGIEFQCGACCLWEVPPGVTRARFQLWGAGGGSGNGQCCGGSPFGATGAYASVIIPVSEGDQYTICSGCAFCCFSICSAFGRYPGCASFVNGPGLSNFCAEGGRGTLGDMMAGLGAPNAQRLQNPICTGSGGCICGGSHYCFSNSCASCGIIPYSPAGNYFGTTTSTTEAGIVYGIRGMFPLMCYTSDNFGYECHPPIYGFEDVSQCNPSYTSGNCCGFLCRAACGILRVPGAGGFYTHVMGGAVSMYGDMGRMGMVCVTYR